MLKQLAVTLVLTALSSALLVLCVAVYFQLPFSHVQQHPAAPVMHHNWSGCHFANALAA
jgi:hypothetical protein